MITVEQLSVSFGSKPVLNSVSCRIPDGAVTVLLGKNGSGKSVFLKIIAGLLTPDSGQISINGHTPEPGMYYADPPLVSYLFQKGGLFDSMNIYENIAFPLRRRNEDADLISEKVTRIIARVGLTGNEEKLPSELSGGMQKRVSLARSVVSGSSHILYDDPSAGLDPVLTDSIARMIREIQIDGGVSSLVVTHDVDLAEKVANFVILLHNGSIVFNGSSDEFFRGNDPFAVQFITGNVCGPIEAL